MSFAFIPRARGVAKFSAPLRFSSVVFNALATADALEDAAAPEGPTWPPKGSRIARARADALFAHWEGEEPIDRPPTAAEQRAYEAFCEARTRWRATSSADPTKFASFKIASNDGWIVSAAEAKVVADALATVLADDDQLELLADILDLAGDAAVASLRKGLERFRAFNAKCAAAEGYEVW